MFALKQLFYFILSPTRVSLGAPWWRNLGCVLFVVLIGFNQAKAEVALVDSDVQLRGTQVNLVLPIVVGRGQAKPVQLKLQWHLSGLVDPKRSIVNVWVNGQIRSTRRLSDGDHRAWQLNLRPLKEGAHELRIEVYLRAKDDDCLPVPEGLWFTLLPSSRIAGASHLVKNTASSLAVKDFPQAWHPSAKKQLTTGGPEYKAFVRVSTEHPWDISFAAAYLQAQIYLAQEGLASRKNAPSSEQAGQLILRSFDRLEATHPARARWAIAANTRFVLYASGADRLEIITQDPQHISSALQLLADDTLRTLCNESLCSSSDGPVKPTASTRTDHATQTHHLLWHMAQGDQPRGWTAQGVGVHKLRQVWVRPLAVELKSEVNFFLAARASQAAALDAAQSSISLRINDQPLATYSLQDWKAEHASVRIPESLWRAAVWVIDFEVRLTPRPEQRCKHLAQEDFWFNLDPRTRLNAKFEYRDAAGIAGFWQRASERATLALAWSGSDSATPTPEQLALFVPLLQAFTSRTTDSVAPRWTFLDPSACKSTACIVLHPAVPSPSAYQHPLHWRDTWRSVIQPIQRMPDLHAPGTAVIAWTPQDRSQAEQLHLVLGARMDSPVTTAQLGSFNGPIAIHTDQWQIFSAGQANTKHSDEQPAPGNISQQQGRLRWVNLIWAALSLVIVITLALLYWRKKKIANTTTWEVN
jgi:Bacterial cellulose synthase subunit